MPYDSQRQLTPPDFAAAPTSFTTASQFPGVTVEDFDGYASDAALSAAYIRHTGGDAVTASLGTGSAAESGKSLQIGYTLGTNGWIGLQHSFPTAQTWTNATGLKLKERATTSPQATVPISTTPPASDTDDVRSRRRSHGPPSPPLDDMRLRRRSSGPQASICRTPRPTR
ncbi:hypothetical protein [Nonomuraea sp. NPDC049695]|uniref:hypothetical protein n=1 Tax=Nonomuraea sp. NPDC049695 TaxID=3154734 RepID=UPI00341ECECE